LLLVLPSSLAVVVAPQIASRLPPLGSGYGGKVSLAGVVVAGDGGIGLCRFGSGSAAILTCSVSSPLHRLRLKSFIFSRLQ
jgi:hypothetical protein